MTNMTREQVVHAAERFLEGETLARLSCAAA